MFSRSVAEIYSPAFRQERVAKLSGASKSSYGAKWIFTPVLAPMLQNRWLALILAGLGVCQIMLTATGLGLWKCPIQSALGVTCPGCGMTTAMVMLFKGNWAAAVQLHAFAPLVTGILILTVVIGILPLNYQHKITQKLALMESRSGITTMVLMAMIVYWLLRTVAIN